MQLGLTGILVQGIVEKPELEGEILGTLLAMNLISSIACVIGVNVFV